jgi:2-polyprenyl-3-methyl-5-hydroxy-6-metoxy-1,4-benzoquinol methylase
VEQYLLLQGRILGTQVVDGYRLKIYPKYASIMQDLEPFFNEEEARRWGRAYDYYFRGWLPEKKDAAIVDLGCGGGRLLYFFKERGYTNVTGVDISLEQVHLARQVVQHVFHANIMDFLQSHSNSFDIITGLDIIEHFHKDEIVGFLDLCVKAMRKGGRLILQTNNAETPWGTMHRYNDLTHEVCFNANALRRLLNLFGFDSIEAREQGPVPWGYSLASSARFAAWQVIRLGLMFWNLVETGGRGSGVFTRIFLVSGCKVLTNS